MAQVTISVNNRPFEIICRDGEEEHVRKLADDLARRVAEIKRSNSSAHDAQLYVLAALALCDELRGLRDDSSDAPTRAALTALSERLEHLLRVS